MSWGYEKDSDRFLSPCVLKIKGTSLGLPMMRMIIFGGLYWGALIFGSCHMRESNEA